MKLVIATQNESKLKEIKEILKSIKLPVVSLNKLDRKFNIRENGKTFFENAVKKTKPVSLAYKDDLVAGEDSGLEVDFLKGAPGVYSKRYSGKNWTYEKNNLKILKELEGVPRKKRKANFHCCLVLFRAGKLMKRIDGRLNGYISEEPKGSHGFGYDPIFYLPKYKATIAQLPLRIKNKLSHRAKAFLKLKKYLNNDLLNRRYQ
ncbi:MAG: RdgB/HAM1 family non-canonical purine NTP pyrophosphatase [Candidatus Omnitrophica bacterium]|jgi:XTP/dITP diphosphohydrolase|nr:RdgB/HAM1 family non-canonical purine NTP pyrophosphatase [Candidatus Omnitrophota bacterium]